MQSAFGDKEEMYRRLSLIEIVPMNYDGKEIAYSLERTRHVELLIFKLIGYFVSKEIL